MTTTFSAARMEFSKSAHRAAQEQFYARLFPFLEITFVDTVNTIRDLDYAIDCELAVAMPGLRAPLKFAIQERWRNPEDMHWGDVTVTEWNLDTNEPSELHKLGAHLLVYGFYDQFADRILAAVAIDIPRLLHALANSELSYLSRRRGDQSFFCFSLRDLKKIGSIVFQMAA